MKICKQGHRFEGYCKVCKAKYYEANKDKILVRINTAHHENKERENAKSRAYYAANASRLKDQTKKYRVENASTIAEAKQKYQSANAEKIKDYKKAHEQRDKITQQAWEEANKEKRNAQGKAYRQANKEKLNAKSREYCAANPDIMLAKVRKRDAAKMKRKPIWCDDKKNKVVYTAAKKAKLTVDHIIPLQGELVSGLHWHHNLQLLSLSENSSKGNSFDPDAYVHELPCGTITA